MVAESIWGVLHVAVCRADNDNSQRQKLRVVHPWAAFHQSALPCKAHTDTATQPAKPDTPKQTHTCISQYSTDPFSLIQIVWKAETLRTRFSLFIT